MPCHPSIAAFALPHYDEAMSFSDTVFLFFLALILFGPKKLPEMARQAGRILAQLRRASNEFRSQIETEISHLEVKNEQAKVAPNPPPQDTAASLSVNPAVEETVPHHTQTPATLAAPPAEGTGSSDAAPSEPVEQPTDSISQASHV